MIETRRKIIPRRMNQYSPRDFHALPIKSSIQSYLEELHRQFANLFEGEVASYIPELTRADPAWFGIALVTVDPAMAKLADGLVPLAPLSALTE